MSFRLGNSIVPSEYFIHFSFRYYKIIDLTPIPLGDWMRRIDEKGGDALVRIPEPTNKFPDFVKHLAQRLKLLSPSMAFGVTPIFI